MDMAKPKIRFKGYVEDWEQRKLGEVATFINGRAYSQDELLSSGKYKVLRVGNFYTNDSWYYSDMELDDKYYAVDGDLLYTWSATFGPHLWRGDKVIYHYHIWKVELSEALEKRFAVQLLEQDKQAILSDKNGSTMVHITKKGMEEKEVILPTNVNEQRKIGNHLDALDHLITLHQRKCEEVKTLKKFMLQKMFPQNGMKVPEIRFNGFTDDWEQRKLGELSSSFEYGLNAAAKSYDGKNKYIRITDIDDETRTFLDSDLTSPDCDLALSENYLLQDGDIVFARTGASVGKTFIYKASDGVVYYAGFLIRARLKENVSPQFVFYNTLTKKYEKFIRITSQRSGQPGVNAQEYATFELFLPKYEEQCEIGKFFCNLDHLITLHQRKCDELQKIKKFMLQNMFI